jgi:beta-glucanase (GH16 family)
MFNLNHFIKHKFRDAFSNLKSIIKSRIWSKSYKGLERLVKPPGGYSIVFEDDFKGSLNKKEWRIGQEWGEFHPNDLHQYYGGDTFAYTEDGSLILELRNDPKSYIKSELPEWRQVDQLPEEFTIPTGGGLVKTYQSWQYGWFEAWIKLPKGTPYWPAFWLSGANSWPPEIDILEAYSNKGDYYADKDIFGRLITNRRIQPNIHYGDDKIGSKRMYGSYSVDVAESTNRFVHYACLWEEDKIEIYYDGIIVFRCTDSKILEWFNKDNAQQNIILNHGYCKGYGIPDESKMIIKSVKVYQK